MKKEYKFVLLRTYEEPHSGISIEEKGEYDNLEDAFLLKPEDDTGGYEEVRYIIEAREV